MNIKNLIKQLKYKHFKSIQFKYNDLSNNVTHIIQGYIVCETPQQLVILRRFSSSVFILQSFRVNDPSIINET